VVKNLDITKVSINKEGGIDFTLTINFDPVIFKPR